jgi:hypothetical protein
MAVIAVVCDFIENISLLQLINTGPDDTYAKTAFILASLKFLLLSLILIHFFISVLISAVKGTQQS